MQIDCLILIVEALTVYLIVLGTHTIRHRLGLTPFYALLGCLTAVVSWVTDAGLCVQVGPLSFVVGSTVFYTSLLLGVFVVHIRPSVVLRAGAPAPTRQIGFPCPT